MFKIEAVNSDVNAPVLELNDALFHEALKMSPASMERFHVNNSKGDDFDIVYFDNDEDIEPRNAYPSYIKPPYMVKYLIYDEYDKETLYLDFFNGLKEMAFEELNEYTIVLTKVVLKYTDMEVWCPDSRILWFVDENERLHIVDELPEDMYKETCFYIQTQLRVGMEDNNFNRLSSTYAFHNIFFKQWLLDGREVSQFKYMTVPIDEKGGIGAVLTAYVNLRSSFEQFGLKFVAPDEEYLGKFPRKLMEQYFNASVWDADANESNTLTVPDLIIFLKTKFYQKQNASIDTSVINPSFMAEMDEYYDAVFGEKKTLGILIRGSDYIATGLSGVRKMATVEQMLPTIHKWMSDYGYEKLFLATEDRNILKQMRAEFGSRMVALSQERITVEDLKPGQIISEYERNRSGDEYTTRLEDTTVNYFYALYILSRCNAFLCSGQCNGWDTVRALNEGRYERAYKFAVGINGDPRTEGWKEICPVTAGMFARGCYPTDKAFFMTFRFDLSEAVNPEAIRKAWGETLKAYPLMGYAIVTRGSRLVFTENPLPFVIEETGEVVEPFMASGNFHTVTFCYLGKTLCIYVDHVAVDGMGAKMVFETFFYHYYCTCDNCTYPVPDGIHSGADGAVPELEKDAYLLVDPIDPKALMAGSMKSNTFDFPEDAQNAVFIPKEDCRAFCLSVPKEELMTYARSVKGSPSTVLSVFAAKALHRVHPENELPIKIMSSFNIRKTLGSVNSLIPQVVHGAYEFDPVDIENKDDETLNTMHRSFMNGFRTEDNIKMMSGIYRGITEGFKKAFKYGALDKVVMDQRKGTNSGMFVSYLGAMNTGEYGSRIRMKAFHVMQEKGIMLQVAEIGGIFYIDWYQGFHGESYIKAMRDLMLEAGIRSAALERVE